MSDFAIAAAQAWVATLQSNLGVARKASEGADAAAAELDKFLKEFKKAYDAARTLERSSL